MTDEQEDPFKKVNEQINDLASQMSQALAEDIDRKIMGGDTHTNAPEEPESPFDDLEDYLKKMGPLLNQTAVMNGRLANVFPEMLKEDGPIVNRHLRSTLSISGMPVIVSDHIPEDEFWLVPRRYTLGVSFLDRPIRIQHLWAPKLKAWQAAAILAVALIILVVLLSL